MARAWPLLLSASVALGACLVACGGPASAPVSPPTQALSGWSNFPVDQVPRPIILMEDVPIWPGFSGADQKMAALCRRFAALAVELPGDAMSLATVSWPDGSSAQYPAITALEAFRAMTEQAPKDQSPGCASTKPLNVTGASLGATNFPTDRGNARMAAWLFTVPGALGPAGFPAVRLSAFWEGKVGTNSASLSRDRLSLTYHFIGGAPGSGPCQGEYQAALAESRTAVAVAIESIRGSVQPPAGSAGCTLVGYARSVVVRLSRPLGNRVVLDETGAAVTVLPASAGS